MYFCRSILGAERPRIKITILEHAARREVQQRGLCCIQRERYHRQTLYGEFKRYSTRNGDG